MEGNKYIPPGRRQLTTENQNIGASIPHQETPIGGNNSGSSRQQQSQNHGDHVQSQYNFGGDDEMIRNSINNLDGNSDRLFKREIHVEDVGRHMMNNTLSKQIDSSNEDLHSTKGRIVNKYQESSQYQQSDIKTIVSSINDQNELNCNDSMCRGRNGDMSNSFDSSQIHNKISNNDDEKGNLLPKKSRVVEIDSLVLIKVQKHCRDNYPTAVNGQLLGMDTGNALEITNCFPLPQRRDIYNAISKKGVKDIDSKVDEEFEVYQDNLAELMHDLNVDCFTVGWYQTLSFGDLKNKDNIDSLVLYQELVDKAILLGFDPLLNAVGKMPFKGFRVSDEFLSLYHEAEGDVSKYNKLRAKDILIEVPILIKNPLLVQAYLADYAASDKALMLNDFESLELDQNNYLEKNLNFLSDCLDELAMEQEKLYKYNREYLKQQQVQKQIIERRRVENEQRALRGEPLLSMEFDGPAFRKVHPPSQIHTLLLSNQAGMKCKELSQISKETLSRMFLLHRIQSFEESCHM